MEALRPKVSASQTFSSGRKALRMSRLQACYNKQANYLVKYLPIITGKADYIKDTAFSLKPASFRRPSDSTY